MATQTYVNGVTLSDAAEWNNWDTSAYMALTGVAGSNTITATGPANYTLSSRHPISWIQATTNTGATTLNVTPSGGSALTAKAVFVGGAACVGGELIAGVPYAAIYDGTQFQVVSAGYSSGTWAASLTGCTTVPTYTATCTTNGKQVTIDIPNVTGTSNTNAKTLTGMPVQYRPATAKVFVVTCIDNGGSGVAGGATIATSGVITLFPTPNQGAWTTSGTMFGQGLIFTYTLA